MIGSFNRHPQWTVSCMLRPHSKERVELLGILNDMDVPQLWTSMIIPSCSDKDAMIQHGACHPALKEMDSIGLAHNDQYLKQINNSRACISIPGGGFDTLRFWEILAQGSLLISKRISIVIPNAPVEGIHYLAFDTLQELKQVISFVLTNPKTVDRIRWRGYNHALRYHTSQARQSYFLQTILGLTK